MQAIGARHGHLVQPLVAKLFHYHEYLDEREPRVTDHYCLSIILTSVTNLRFRFGKIDFGIECGTECTSNTDAIQNVHLETLRLLAQLYTIGATIVIYGLIFL